ncbi:hypothetical protein POM88_029187 [Heracleum sosnowskyi]|uniref:Uncharacterized protein n=1 Tax=Heracleum sosnowskyi TaxID=360622 RepID=A0AAD8MHF7_9APIA|nr:hypothetical protein POM88_029187 [Heracleum sosnowskyi]
MYYFFVNKRLFYLNKYCPDELKVSNGDACKSACEAFGKPEYCCSGAHNTPDTCKPSVYAALFKMACPRAYSYAYDDQTSSSVTGAEQPGAMSCAPSPGTLRPGSGSGPEPKMSELNSKPQLRQIYHKDWAARSHEMEKISLDSPKKSCGTGFFLPRTVAADFQLTNKSSIFLFRYLRIIFKFKFEFKFGNGYVECTYMRSS